MSVVLARRGRASSRAGYNLEGCWPCEFYESGRVEWKGCACILGRPEPVTSIHFHFLLAASSVFFMLSCSCLYARVVLKVLAFSLHESTLL